MSLFSENFSTVVGCNNLTAGEVMADVVNTEGLSVGTAVVENLVSTSFTFEGSLVVLQSPVISGGETGDLAYSTDGVNFVTVLAPNTVFRFNVNGIAGDSQKWIATASKNMGVGATMAISYNAVGVGSWVAHPSPPPGNNLFGLAYLNNLWLCGGDAGMYYSEDGFTWIACTGTYTGGNVKAFAYGQGKWIATGFAGGGTSLAYSLDGKAWLPCTGAFFDASGNSVAASGNRFVAVGFDNAGYNMLTSTDGINWTNPTLQPPSTTGYSVAVNSYGTMWVASGEGARFYYSTDGLTWTNTGFTSINAAHFVWDGTKFVAAGIGMGGAPKDTAISYNGIHWSLIDTFLGNAYATAINIDSKRGTLRIA